MAYKPFKINNGYFDYLEKEKKTEQKYEIRRMKLFGFRSGIAWKMIPALLYYVGAGLFIFGCINGEISFFEFEKNDIILDIFKYIFLTIILYSPAIFLSEFEYNKQLPVFKGNSVVKKGLALFGIIVFCYCMVWVDQYCMSEKYRASADRYYEEMESNKQQKLEEFESQSRAAKEE